MMVLGNTKRGAAPKFRIGIFFFSREENIKRASLCSLFPPSKLFITIIIIITIFNSFLFFRYSMKEAWRREKDLHCWLHYGHINHY